MRGVAIFIALVLSAVLPRAAFAADPAKTIRFAFIIAETTFDPHAASDLYSNTINDAIFDPLLKYDYLARPAKLKPNIAAALPEITQDGKLYVFHLKPGIYFADDPVFGGTRREVTSSDYAYSLRRILDPQLRSPWVWYLEGKIVGADEAMAAAKASGKFDYDARIAGIETPDRYTLRIRLRETDYNFVYIFATVQTAAVAREVIEKYQPDPGAHPVGSGAFRLKEWKRSSKIVLEANPGFRDEIYDADPGDDPESQAIAARMKGRKLPMVGRIEVSIIEESQPRWLAFLNGETDYANVPNEFVGHAFPEGKLAPNLAKLGLVGERFVEPDIVYAWFNMDDPVVGGYTPDKVALRRAISLAYNIDEDIQVIRKGGAMRAQSGIPPGVAGYDPNFRSPTTYDPARANALLDMYGYVDRDGDGYREFPDGRKLVIEKGSEPDSTTKQFDELWKKNLDAVGLRIVSRNEKWPDLNKAAKLGKLPMWQMSWGADYPDGENFLQILYGPNSGQSNYANFKHKPYDELYERARKMPPSVERNKLYAEMSRIAVAYAPWLPQTHRLRNEIAQPWLVGYRKHPIYNQVWMYLDIDESRRARR